MSEENVRTIAELATGLTEKVADLTKAVKKLAGRLSRNERTVHWTMGIVAVDVILTIVVTTVVYAQYQTNQTLQDTRAGVLCPLYGLIVGSYAPLTRKPGPERDAYNAGFVTLREAYSHLDCPTAPLPPRVVGAPPPR